MQESRKGNLKYTDYEFALPYDYVYAWFEQCIFNKTICWNDLLSWLTDIKHAGKGIMELKTTILQSWTGRQRNDITGEDSWKITFRCHFSLSDAQNQIYDSCTDTLNVTWYHAQSHPTLFKVLANN